MNKQERIDFRCNTEFKLYLQQKATERGLSLSTYILMLLMKEDNPVILTPGLKQCLEYLTYYTKQILEETNSPTALLLNQEVHNLWHYLSM